MKMTWLSLLLASLPAVLPAAYEDITSERYPDADTVLVDEIERVAYNADGTSVTRDESWTKILTEKGRREESTTTLDYSRRYGEASIDHVGVIGPDGCERPIDVSSTTKDSTDNGSMAANIYDPLDRKIVCTIPGLRVGDVVHVKTTRKTFKPRTQGKWADTSVMEWSCPIVRSTYEVKAPAALPIRKIAIRHPLGNVIRSERKSEDGSTVYTFVTTNSPQAFPEPDMPALHTEVQHVCLSTATDWEEISSWYWNLCRPHLDKTNAAMTNKVQELKGDLRAIFKFVSQEIRYMGLTMEDTSPGYAPHDVDITFDNRYGVCRDKAGLLTAMLRIAGHKAFPVLIHVGAKRDSEVPQAFFNHAIVAVDEGNRKYILMDPTNENTKDLFPAYLCNRSYLVCRPEGEKLMTTSVPPPEANAVKVASRGALSKDGSIVLENAIGFGGINDTVYRGGLVRRKPEDRVKFFERLVKAVSAGAELLRCEIEPSDLRDTERPLSVKLVSRFPEMTLDGRTQSELTVPLVSKALGFVNFLLQGNTSLEKRKYPLALDTTARVEESLELNLGDAVGGVKDLPPPMKTEGGYGYRRDFAVERGVLKVNRSLTVGAVEFSPAEYATLREDIKRVEAAERKRPVFAKDTLRDADVRILFDSSETSLVSDRAWVTTNTVVKEVLTYTGKKKSAELKFAYNPTWKKVEVLSATVSNRNGKVSAVTPREMNVMDCAWAASAPRYPAGKLLVVNLPSVEIGSVISVRTVVTVTNAPTAYYATFGFDSQEPLDRRFVRVGDWHREVVRPRRIPNEVGQPYSCLWRDQERISSNRFEKVDLKIGELASEHGSVREIRDWMARHVKVTGPSLYDLPLDCQLTPPEKIVAERYATRLDYIRTMCALLRGAGFDADVVFAANNADDPPEMRERDKFTCPNVGCFDLALCRVTEKSGGVWGIGGETKVMFLGIENEHTPLGATAYEGCDCFDPATGEFTLVTVPEPNLSASAHEHDEVVIRENGAADITVETLRYGVEVGAFRRKYAEILPEDRSRLHQALLGAIAQAASATSELETDVVGYPARRRFSCYVPDYATVSADAITLQLPAFESPVPNYTGGARQTPFAVSSADPSEEIVTVIFPAGYVEIEHLPEPCSFADPKDARHVWAVNAVSSEVKDGRLRVTLRRSILKRSYGWYSSDRFELIKDWRRIADSRANRTIVVRKGKELAK